MYRRTSSFRDPNNPAPTAAKPAVPQSGFGKRYIASFPIDLVRFSIRAEQRKELSKQDQVAQFIASDLLQHAAPLISINHQDVTILDELFWREDITEIAADIEQMLASFLPAPCWDDDPFDLDDSFDLSKLTFSELEE